MTQYVIIVAAGKGHRMGKQLPKQFLLLGNKPILMHSIETFHKQNENTNIILVLDNSKKELWNNLCNEYSFKIPHTVISGGKERYYSVKNGLSFILTQEKQISNVLVAIHDGARPLVSSNLIEKAFAFARLNESAVPSIQSSDSVRIKINTEPSHPIPRDNVFLIQTPQVFTAEMLKEAYQQDYDPNFTDDASVIEKAGYIVNLIEGESKNFKITFSTDLSLASYLLNLRSSSDQSK